MNRIDVIKNIEIRSIGEGNRLEIKGLLPSNTLSETLFSPQKKILFRERIRTGAFASALKDGYTPKVLVNHKYDKELTAEFTTIKETRKGLEFTVVVDNDFELKEKLQEVKGLSFGFVVDVDMWSIREEKNIRDIFSFKELMEISILVGLEPAYSSTEVIIVPEGAEAQLDELERYKLFLRDEQLKILKQQLAELKR